MDSSGEKTYYTILRVSRQATPEEIKKSYRKLARKVHPDKVKESQKEQAKLEFQELQTAYETLSDPQKKEKYDYELENPGFRKESANNAEDVGEEFFSKFRANRPQFNFKAYNASQVNNIMNDFKKKFAEQGKAENSRPKGGFNW